MTRQIERQRRLHLCRRQLHALIWHLFFAVGIDDDVLSDVRSIIILMPDDSAIVTYYVQKIENIFLGSNKTKLCIFNANLFETNGKRWRTDSQDFIVICWSPVRFTVQ